MNRSWITDNPVRYTTIINGQYTVVYHLGPPNGWKTSDVPNLLDLIAIFRQIGGVRKEHNTEWLNASYVILDYNHTCIADITDNKTGYKYSRKIEY